MSAVGMENVRKSGNAATLGAAITVPFDKKSDDSKGAPDSSPSNVLTMKAISPHVDGSALDAANVLEQQVRKLAVLPDLAVDSKGQYSGPPGLTKKQVAATVRMLGVLAVDATELEALGKEAESRAQWRQFSMLMLGYFSSFFSGGVASIVASERYGLTPEQSFAIGMTVLGCGRQYMASTIRQAALDPAYYVQRREPAGFNEMNFILDLASTVGFCVWHMVVDTQVDDPAMAGKLRLASGAAAALGGGITTAILLTRQSQSWGPLLHVWANGSREALPDAAFSRHHVASVDDKAFDESDDRTKPEYARNAHAARMSHAVSSLRKSKCQAIGGALLDLGNGVWRAFGIPGRYAVTGAVTTGLLATAASAPRLKKAHELADVLLGNWGFLWRAKEYFNNSPLGGGPYQRTPEEEFDKVFRNGAANDSDAEACENGEAPKSVAGSSNLSSSNFVSEPKSTNSTPTAISSSSSSSSSHPPHTSRSESRRESKPAWS